MRQFIVLLFLQTQVCASVVLANDDKAHTEPQSDRPDNHALLSVMGDHSHSAGEWMLSYRFMAMGMDGLRDGTASISTEAALHKYTAVSLRMDMHMHMFGAMFAPHDSVTLMAMTSYRDNFMKMQGRGHGKSHGRREHSGESHEMGSRGFGDTKLSALLPLLRLQDAIILLNAEVSIPTSSIEQEGKNGILPYAMQLGSGSFELMPGVTFYAPRNNWSFGVQTRAAIPMNENGSGYRRAPLTMSMLWRARRLNNWVSVSVCSLFENWGNIAGEGTTLNPQMTPTMDTRLQGASRASLLLGSNLNLLAGQRFALEIHFPIYQPYLPHYRAPKSLISWVAVSRWVLYRACYSRA